MVTQNEKVGNSYVSAIRTRRSMLTLVAQQYKSAKT